MLWTYAYARVRGASHIKNGTRIQDAIKCVHIPTDTGDKLACVISDGAGSAEFGGQGASLVCRMIGNKLRSLLATKEELPSEEDVWSWVDDARDLISHVAARRDRRARDFACTLVMFVAMPNGLMTAHIGDGAIVARREDTGEWQTVSAPENGEYASTTFFVTDELGPALRVEHHTSCYDALAAFSDGIEGMVLNLATKEPSSAFFNPMLRPLVSNEAFGWRRDLTGPLASFFQSERVLERTDDDISFMMAVRR